MAWGTLGMMEPGVHRVSWNLGYTGYDVAWGTLGMMEPTQGIMESGVHVARRGPRQ